MVVSMLTLPSCKKDEPPAPPVKPAALVKVVAPPVPVQKQASSVKSELTPSMDFIAKKDPFKPFVTAEPAVKAPKVALSKAADLLPIQSFEVTKFKVSGIIAGLQENKALLVDPAGKGYVVKEGMLIGNNDGRITRITASSVEVVERYRANNGKLHTRKTVISLSKKK
jgi:type IV pilus assembly protein PilP